MFFEALTQSWKIKFPKLPSIYFFCAILFAIIPVFILHNEKIFIAENGHYGLFIEKGILGQYLAVISCLLVANKKNKLNNLVFFVTLFYVIFIIQSNRAILIYLCFFILQGKYNSFSTLKLIKYLLFIILISGTSIFLFPDVNLLLMDKVKLLLNPYIENPIGRYAASYLIYNLDTWEILFGRGLGSYLTDRRDILTLLQGQAYDYPGSLILQSIYELGTILTLILSIFFTKAVFGDYKFRSFVCIILLGLTGGFQDIFQMFLYYVFNILNHYRNDNE